MARIVAALRVQCERSAAHFPPGTLFSNRGRFDHGLRINCGSPWSEALEDGLRRLGALATQQAWA